MHKKSIWMMISIVLAIFIAVLVIVGIVLNASYGRIYLGYHSVGDTLGGCAFGIILALIIFFLWKAYRLHKAKR